MRAQRPGAVRLIAIAFASAFVCILALGLVVASRPRTFASYTDAIGYKLDQRNIAYERIALAQTRLDSLNFYSYGRYSAPYGAGVTIQLAAGRRVNGRLECRVQMTSCYLYLSDLGFNGELLPDVTAEQRWTPLDWMLKYLPTLPTSLSRQATPTPGIVP